MARPQTKEDLIIAASENYEKLIKLLDNLTIEELNTELNFEGDEKKKEAHWKRDKSIRDVIMHLHEWHKLLLNWLENQKDEVVVKRPFLMEGYNWKTYGDMNQLFFENAQMIEYEEARKLFDETHKKVMAAMEAFPENIMFKKAPYDWVGTSSIGSYFVSVTSSHYDWAMKKIKAHKKKVSQRASKSKKITY